MKIYTRPLHWAYALNIRMKISISLKKKGIIRVYWILMKGKNEQINFLRNFILLELAKLNIKISKINWIDLRIS